jgi:hypothetical protein
MAEAKGGIVQIGADATFDDIVKGRPTVLPSPPALPGEREGSRRVSDGEGEVGGRRSSEYPHPAPALSAPGGALRDKAVPARQRKFLHDK